MPIKSFGDMYDVGDEPGITALLGNQLLEDCFRKCGSEESAQEPVGGAAVILGGSDPGVILWALPLLPVAQSPVTLCPKEHVAR